MKLRKLKKLLNDTDYIIRRKIGSINFYDTDVRHDIICIGSPYVHDLISYDVESGKFGHACSFDPDRDKYALELIEIWNRMHELAESGELGEIASGNDDLLNPIPVFTFRDYKIVKTFTEKDEFGWPFFDNEGWLMYNNTSFRTERECRAYAIGELIYGLNIFSRNLRSRIADLHKDVENLVTESKVLTEMFEQWKQNENPSSDRKSDGL